jgi:hypothetical protein
MPRSQRVQCTHQGCSARYCDTASMQKHADEPHAQCVCGRHATVTGMKTHQRSCSVHQLERSQKLYTCSGCELEIPEGAHYLRIPEIMLQTRMPVGWNPVRDMPDNSLRDMSFCGPVCLMTWLVRNEQVQEVFGFPLRHDYGYEVNIEGRHIFLPLEEVLQASRTSWAYFRLGTMVNTSGPNRRHMTGDELLFLMLLTRQVSE